MRGASVSSTSGSTRISCRRPRASRRGARGHARKVLLLVEQRLRFRQRLGIGPSCRNLVRNSLSRRAFFVPIFSPPPWPCLRTGSGVQVVEAARDLAREFDVRHLVLAHRHVPGAVDQDVADCSSG